MSLHTVKHDFKTTKLPSENSSAAIVRVCYGLQASLALANLP